MQRVDLFVGPATSAELGLPVAVAVDAAGNLFIADIANGRIRKVDTDGTITTVAGTGSPGSHGFRGDGGPATSAELAGPSGVAVPVSHRCFYFRYCSVSTKWRPLR